MPQHQAVLAHGPWSIAFNNNDQDDDIDDDNDHDDGNDNEDDNCAENTGNGENGVNDINLLTMEQTIGCSIFLTNQ